jgi:hypothetical protein
MPLVVQFMNQPSFKENKFDVDATLSDCCKGWTAATIEEFQIEANMCINHVTGILAANYSQAKYYKSREVYDLIYDFKVRISQIRIEFIAVKAHLALPRYLIEEHDNRVRDTSRRRGLSKNPTMVVGALAMLRMPAPAPMLAWNLCGRTRRRFVLRELFLELSLQP